MVINPEVMARVRGVARRKAGAAWGWNWRKSPDDLFQDGILAILEHEHINGAVDDDGAVHVAERAIKRSARHTVEIQRRREMDGDAEKTHCETHDIALDLEAAMAGLSPLQREAVNSLREGSPSETVPSGVGYKAWSARIHKGRESAIDALGDAYQYMIRRFNRRYGRGNRYKEKKRLERLRMGGDDG